MNTPETVISAINLNKKFGELVAVRDLSLDIRRGEIFGFLGPNGAGKTTTILMVCGLLKPTSGEVYIFNEKLKQSYTIKSRIGICPQENVFWPRLTCLEQLTFTGRMHNMTHSTSRKRSGLLLEMLGLAEKSGVQARKLSGGMKRRLSICLALVHDPEILILDEPEAGLDPQSRVLVREYIRSLAHDKTIILTTHNMDEADRMADRVAIIDYGKLLLIDTPSHLKKSVGEGDILEVTIDDHNEEKLIKVRELLGPLSDHISTRENHLMIRSRNIIEKIPDIISHVRSSGIEIREVRVRENTLEDVFIHLTGRKLRE